MHRVDLLAGVEDVGDVDRRLGDGAGQLEHDGQAGLHVGGAEAVEGVAVDAGAALPLPLGTVSRWPASTSRLGPPSSVRATTLSPTRLDVEPRHRPQLGLEVVGDGPLVVADRRDVDELGGERQQIGHRSPGSRGDAVLAEDVVELGLVVALALGEPLDDEHARQPELAAGELRRRVAYTATHHGGTTPG